MKIALVQHNILWSAKQANLEKIRSLIDSAPGADVYVLPEMFATGFLMKPERIAESYPGEVVAWMTDLAREKSAAIIGSVSVAEGGNYYNRLIMAKPDGAVEYYDKRHLFSFAGEDGKYACGKERKVFEFRGVRFLPLCAMICVFQYGRVIILIMMLRYMLLVGQTKESMLGKHCFVRGL